jgi:hypothetical protein
MGSNFWKERRGPLKSTRTFVETLANTSVRGSFGCMLSNWDVPGKQFLCLCHDALFELWNVGVNTGRATSHSLPYIPFQAVDGRLVAACKPGG